MLKTTSIRYPSIRINKVSGARAISEGEEDDLLREESSVLPLDECEWESQCLLVRSLAVSLEHLFRIPRILRSIRVC